jgi:MFS family permease
MYFVAGAVGIMGNIVAGRVSDRFGRRTIGGGFMLVAPLFAMLFYHSSSSPILVAAWVLQLFADTASSTICTAYSAELFPTSYRSTAGSALAAADTLGRALGLLLESWFYGLTGSHWTAISCLLVFWMVPGVLIFLFFPETAGQELEAISPEAAAASN